MRERESSEDLNTGRISPKAKKMVEIYLGEDTIQMEIGRKSRCIETLLTSSPENVAPRAVLTQSMFGLDSGEPAEILMQMADEDVHEINVEVLSKTKWRIIKDFGVFKPPYKPVGYYLAQVEEKRGRKRLYKPDILQSEEPAAGIEMTPQPEVEKARFFDVVKTPTPPEKTEVPMPLENKALVMDLENRDPLVREKIDGYLNDIVSKDELKTPTVSNSQLTRAFPRIKLKFIKEVEIKRYIRPGRGKDGRHPVFNIEEIVMLLYLKDFGQKLSLNSSLVGELDDIIKEELAKFNTKRSEESQPKS